MSADLPKGGWATTTTWLLAASVLRNLGLIVILVLLARFTSTEVVGQYALALAMTTPVFLLAQLGLRGVYLTLRRDYRFTSYLTIQLATVLLAIAISICIGAIFSPGAVLTVTLVAVIKSSDALSELFSGPLQGYGQARLIFVAYLVAAALGSAVTAVALALTRNLDVALAGLALSSLLTALLLMARSSMRLVRHREGDLHRSLHPRDDRRAILRAGLPTGVAGAVIALVASMPQLFLAPTHGQTEVGHFAVLLYVLAIVDIFAGTLTQAWIPRARQALRDHPDDDFTFLRSVAVTAGWWTAAFIPAAVLGLWIVSLLLPIVFGPAYQLGLPEAIPLAVGVVLFPSVHFAGTAMVVHNYYVHGVTLGLVALVVSFVACLTLVGPLGVVGALWATVAALAARAAFAYAILFLRARRSPVVSWET